MIKNVNLTLWKEEFSQNFWKEKSLIIKKIIPSTEDSGEPLLQQGSNFTIKDL